MDNSHLAHSQPPAADASINATLAAKISPVVFEVDDAAKFLCIGRAKFYKLLRSGAINSRRIGKRRVILVESLMAFIKNAPRD